MSGNGVAASFSLIASDPQYELPPPNPYDDDPPSYADCIARNKAEQRFLSRRAWKDVWAIVCYYLNFLMFCGLSAFGSYSLFERNDQGVPLAFKSQIISNVTNLIVKNALSIQMISTALTVAVGISAVITFLYALIVYFFAKKMIISFFFGVGILVSYGLRLLFLKKFWPGMVICGGGLLLGLWFCYIYRRMKFSVQIMKTVMLLVLQYPLIALMTLVAISLQIVVALLWGYGFLGYKLRFGSDTRAMMGLHLFLFCSFLWNSRFIISSLHTACSGVFCAYYFLGDTVQMPKRTFRTAIRNAIGPGSGSVAIGSLTIAMIQIIRIVAFCIFERRGLKMYLNLYTLVLVAIHGKSFAESAKTCARLFGRKGFDLIFKDNLAESVFLLGAVDVAILSGVGGWVVVTEGNRILDSPGGLDLNVSFICGLIGFFVFSVISAVISAGIASICVCFAQDPQALRRSAPNMCAMLCQVYPNIQYPVMQETFDVVNQ